MSSKTEYTCDGCGLTNTSTVSCYGPKVTDCHYCSECWSRMVNNATPPSLVQERLDTVVKAHIEATEQHNAERTRWGEDRAELERHLEDARKIIRDVVADKEAVTKECERALQLDSAKKSTSEHVKRLEKQEVELSDARDEAELAIADARRVVHELMGMLGKKARKKYKKRLRELRLAYADPVQELYRSHYSIEFADKVATLPEVKS